MSRLSRIATVASVTAISVVFAAPVTAQETFKLGIVTFLSGPAADSFGVPARNGAQFVIDQLNKGAAPSPYEKVGFGGMKVEPVIIDENGGATKQVQELRNLRATMSTSCLAISAPATALRSRRSPKS